MKENTNNVIYAYKRKSTGKIVYIGQTVNLTERHKVHTRYDPFNPHTREYEYPLSRGIRKYGANEYELIVLEDNIPREELDKREKYWIEYYNTYWDGYNQSIGGTYPTKPIFTEDQIDTVIEMLRDESYSYQDIINKTGISMTHIYNINIGARRKRDNIDYPIRKSNVKGTKGLKLTPEQNLEVHKLLKNTSKTFSEIGRMFGIASDTVSDINRGKTKSYKLEDWNYPIRSLSQARAAGKSILSKQQVEEIVALLFDSSLTLNAIAKKYQVCPSTITNINNGKTLKYRLDNIEYPIRK